MDAKYLEYLLDVHNSSHCACKNSDVASIQMWIGPIWLLYSRRSHALENLRISVDVNFLFTDASACIAALQCCDSLRALCIEMESSRFPLVCDILFALLLPRLTMTHLIMKHFPPLMMPGGHGCDIIHRTLLDGVGAFIKSLDDCSLQLPHNTTINVVIAIDGYRWTIDHAIVKEQALLVCGRFTLHGTLSRNDIHVPFEVR
ncbi:hypothetical protein OBBRIDRAFT_117743 [Obba rivulosa]|uniref:Uncharacterized protein n=1 Tax=Obba rivulosa TaxID=1052685 RepID=A0A8E2ANX4_9APHY|nr:hypothetical protein OBBRIDRAFT_117743 [Obba rivulosa]